MNMEKKQNNICPLCKSISKTNMAGLSKYRYCSKCSLGWIIAKPNVSYGKNYYQSGSSLLATLFIPIAKLFYSIRQHYVEKKQNSPWIDVGAGDGGFLQSINAKKRIGIETSHAGISIMKSRGLQTMTDKQFLKSINLNASVISFWHMLEHVERPWEYLAAARKNLKQTGNIVIGVPNVESFELKLFKKYWFHLSPQFHIWYFSPKAIKKMLKQTGYKIISIDFWSPEHHFPGLLQSVINVCTRSDNVLHRLIKRKQTFSNLKIKDIFWVLFWCTIGLPILILFWIISAFTQKSGTFVVVASKDKSYN